MKLLNYALFALLLVVSSWKTDDENLTTNKFDYSVYNAKNGLFNTLNKINLKKTNSRVSGLAAYEDAIETINEEYGTNAYVTEFDQYLMANPNATIDDCIQNGYINQQDYNVVNSFFDDLDTYNFDQSIQRLQTRILNQNYSPSEFEKYNFFVNALMVINDYYLSQGVDVFAQAGANKNIASRMSAGCAVSIASNAISTYGLTSCFVPGPNCWVAIVGKGLSLAGIFLSC